MTDEEFKEAVLALIPTERGCREWPKSTKKGGKVTHLGKQKRANRVSYEVFHGPIPSGHYVLHHCDNPPCVAPEHLFTGTHFDNMKDMALKGRQVRKLSDDAVREIRSAPMLIVEAAKKFGVNISTISRIRHRLRFKHLV